MDLYTFNEDFNEYDMLQQKEAPSYLNNHFSFTQNFYYSQKEEILPLQVQNQFYKPERLQTEKEEESTQPIKNTASNQSSNISKETQQKINFGHEVISKYKAVFQGKKNDTMELSINFKTLLVNVFKEKMALNQLNQFQKVHLLKFIKCRPSFSSLMQFYSDHLQNKDLRFKCLQLFSSAQCIHRIMKSRCKIHTKIQMVKFIQKMRINLMIKGPPLRWKDCLIKREKKL